MTGKAIGFIVIAAVLAVGCGPQFGGSSAVQRALAATDRCATATMVDIAPFDWDRAVVLRAYMGQDDVIARYGFDPGSVPSALQDGVLTVYFIKGDREIVASGEFPDTLFRFEGDGVVVHRDSPELTVYTDSLFYEYFVPAGSGPRNPDGGPAEFDGCL